MSKIRRLSTAGALVVLALAGVFWRPRPAAEFDPLSIVILPPVDHSEHSSFRYLIETVHGEIISELRSATALRIRSEYSARQYRDSTKPLGEIARELGVATVVHGSARASKESVHVRFEIIQTRPVEKQLAVVQESADRTSLSTLAARVANGILAHVLPDAAPAATFARDSIAGVRRVDAEAYEAYLSGKYAWSRMMADSMYKAIELYRFAIARDSHFVRAYIGLAEAYAFLPYYAPVEARNAFPVAKQAAQKALALDSTSGAAHAILGWATLVYDLDWRRAEVHMRRAIELSPRYATGRMLYSWLLTATHRFDEAIAQDLEASADDPLSPRIKAHLGIVYEFSRQFDRAIAQFRSTLARDSGFVRARTDLGVTYLHMGDARLAIEHLSKAVAASPAGAGSVNPRTYLAEAMALAGNRDSARTLLEALLAERRVRYIPPLNIARILVALGDVNEAFPWFDRAFDEHDPDLILLDVSPSYDAVREDARFRALLRRGGFRRGTP